MTPGSNPTHTDHSSSSEAAPSSSRGTDASMRIADHAFYCRSCESMPELADGSVTLTMTSPPYWSLVDFEAYCKTKDHARTWANSYVQQYATYQEYLAAMARAFAEVYRVTKPGGILALQVASMQRDGRCYPIGFDLVPRLVELGWEYREHILWNKCRDTSKRSSLAIKHPYPGYFYPALIAEHLFIFRKHGPRLFEGVDPQVKARAKLPASTLFTRDVLKSVWHIPTIAPRSVDHPTVYPEELCHRVIALYSYPGDLVLDPFVGSGQTTKVAWAMGRRCVGYDIEPTFVEYARSRVNEPLRLRVHQVVPRYEHVENDPFMSVGDSPPPGPPALPCPAPPDAPTVAAGDAITPASTLNPPRADRGATGPRGGVGDHASQPSMRAPARTRSPPKSPSARPARRRGPRNTPTLATTPTHAVDAASAPVSVPAHSGDTATRGPSAGSGGSGTSEGEDGRS